MRLNPPVTMTCCHHNRDSWQRAAYLAKIILAPFIPPEGRQRYVSFDIFHPVDRMAPIMACLSRNKWFDPYIDHRGCDHADHALCKAQQGDIRTRTSHRISTEGLLRHPMCALGAPASRRQKMSNKAGPPRPKTK
jgi:hypothetical protein